MKESVLRAFILGLLLSIVVFFEIVVSKPRIVGQKIVKVYFGEDVAIECWGNKDVNWYKLVNKTSEASLIDEESNTEHIHLDIPDYVDFPENMPRNANETHLAVLKLEQVIEKESGTYVCVYQHESDDMPKLKNRILRNKTKLFSTVLLTVLSLKPTIDNGDSVVVDPGQDINMTCRGEKPVTWIFLTNHTTGVQHLDTIVNNQHLSVLELRNVNYTDVGYFICSYVSSTQSFYEDFDHKNDPNTTSTYLFVKDVDHLLTLKGVHSINIPVNTPFTIPCKPTFPEVKVTFDRMEVSPIQRMKSFIGGHNLQDGAIVVFHKASSEVFLCEASYLERREQVKFNVDIYHERIPNTNVSVGDAWQINSMIKDIHTYDVRERSVVLMNCTAAFYRSSQEKIMWAVPNEHSKYEIYELSRGDSIQETRIISAVSLGDSGIYSCYVTNGYVNSSAYEFALNVFPAESSHLELKAQSPNITLGRKGSIDALIWIIYFRSYPDLTLIWKFEGEEKVRFIDVKNPAVDDSNRKMTQRKEQYEIKVNWTEGEIILKIHSPTIRNVGEYTLEALNKKLTKKIELRFLMEGKPEEVVASLEPVEALHKKGSKIFIKCSAYGYPVSSLSVIFIPCASFKMCGDDDYSINNQYNHEKLTNSTNLTGLSKFFWEAEALEQGKYACMAKNIHGTMNSTTIWLTVTDSELDQKNYLQIEMERNSVLTVPSYNISLIEDDNVTFTCRANNLRTSFPLVWNVESGAKNWALFGNRSFTFQGREISLLEFQTKYSYVSQIRTKISKDMEKLKLVCSDSSSKPMEQAVILHVRDAIGPIWTSKELNQEHFDINENENLSFFCSGTGVPVPKVTWFKNGESNWTEEIDKGRISITTDGNLTFAYVFPSDSGKYSCQIENRVGLLEDYLTLEVIDPDAAPNQSLYISIGVIASLFCVVIVYLLIRICKERRRNKALRLMKEKIFMNGSPESLNPDLDLGEQADLLPYDSRFEFPKQQLIMDKLLGTGAFGNVHKCTALNLVAGESKTTVAVKMVKSDCEEGQLKALRTELKIMVHIGRHINIVNLLGACSKDIFRKGELFLIVEYCRHGNLLDYMRRHRAEFIDQINIYGKIDARLKRSVRNTTGSRASFRTTYAQLDMPSTPSYDSWENQRFSCSDSSCKSTVPLPYGRKRIQSEGTADNETASTDMTTATIYNSSDNYVSETTLEKLGPFCSKTLLHWAFQVANGMFYLSERKIIHGDLAARNLLLADRNVVKISDFGLSKNIYKQANYKKKSKGPLPVKWLALEAIRDNIYSTQSDVWSFGVALWEIFTLGQSPYHGIEIDENFLQKLDDGYRLRQPYFATLELYEIMEQCWNAEPNQRPTFRYLEKKLGDMLGETEREMYMALNAPYEENNMYSEHLKRIRTPTYDSRAQCFFPSDMDEHGYEVPITTVRPGMVMMEHEIHDTVVPRLHPVPGGRKSTLTIELPCNPAERESLMNSTDENYLVMSTPTLLNVKQQHFTFDDIPLQEKCQKTYQNLPHPTMHRSTLFTEEKKCLVSSPKEQEGRDGENEENDLVFPPSPKELTSTSTPKEDRHSQTQNTENEQDFPNTNVNKSVPSHDVSHMPYIRQKHDSGVCFANAMQNNPLYYETSELHSILNSKTNAHNILFSPSIDGPCNKGSKQRTQSDSSSGFGSLSEDKCNSLEKRGDHVSPSTMFHME